MSQFFSEKALPQLSRFRQLFHPRPPDGLVEISDHILVFDHCFSTDIFAEDELKPYIGGILKQLLGRYSIDSFMVFNFEGAKKHNQIARIFSGYGMSVMGYPRNYEGCPLLTMEMIHHFLKSSESWLSLDQDNFLLIHSEQGGWPVLAFALACLLVYLRRSSDERAALEMVHRHAPPDLLELFSPLDPAPSQLRYLKYVSRRHISSDLWPPADRVLNLNCAIIRKVPNFDGQGGCRPIFRIYGPDPLEPDDNSAKVLFSTPKTSDFVQLYTQEDAEIIKVNIGCPVKGDVVIECISLDEDFGHEMMVFRAMFSTAFIEDNLLLLGVDQIDILWDTKHRFPADFGVEVIFSEMDATTAIPSAASGQKGLNDAYDGFDEMSLEEIQFSNAVHDHRLVDVRSVKASEMEAEDSHSSALKFEGDTVAVADAVPLTETEALEINSQEHELFEDASAQEKPEGDTTKWKPSSDVVAEAKSPDSEAADEAIGAAAAEWLDTNTDMFLSDTPSSSAASSPPKFDKDTMGAGLVELETHPQFRELVI